MQGNACLSTKTTKNYIVNHKDDWIHTSMCKVKIQWDLEEFLFKA